MYTVHSTCCCTIHCVSIKSYDCYEKSLNFENNERSLHCNAFGVLKIITSDMAIYFEKSLSKILSVIQVRSAIIYYLITFLQVKI